MSLTEKLAHERRGRLAAERLLELKQAELSTANEKLGQRARDLSEEIIEKRAEAEEARSQAEALKGENTLVKFSLKIAEERLWNSVQSIEDGFAVFDSDHLLIMANDSFISGFDGLEEVKAGIAYSRMLELMIEEGLVDIGQQIGTEWQAEMLERWHSQDLPSRTLKLWNGHYVKLVERRAPGGDTVMLALDITDTIRYETELHAAREKAEAASRTKSAFLANMSHEIRTPINGVVGMADLLRDSPLSEEQQLYVNTIKSSGEALLVIINDVLDYSKMDANKLDLHPEPFDLEAVLFEVQTLLMPSAREKGVDLIAEIEDDFPISLIGDPGRLRQVLVNLIGNAVKFTSVGSVHVRLACIATADESKVQIIATIEDTGIGIDEELIDHIFGEFNQAEEAHTRRFDGTGLGLAIAKQLVELMGGTIWVDSIKGQGSCFAFKIILQRGQHASEAELPDIPAHIKSAFVISQDMKRAEILLRKLRVMGLDCQTYPTLTDGLGALSDHVNLVVLIEELTQTSIEELRSFAEAACVVNPHVSVLPILREHVPGEPPFIHDCVLHPLIAPVPRAEFRKALLPVGPPTDQTTAPDTPQTHTRRMRVLAAEDNQTNRLVFSKMVKTLNIALEFAENGAEAIRSYQAHQPDLIFMDISMPEMDGKQATGAIRKFEKAGLPPVPIIAVTAHAMEGDEAEILAAGLDHYMTKPLRKAAIHDIIAKHRPPHCAPLEIETSPDTSENIPEHASENKVTSSAQIR